jgi:hypothetical protein
MEKRADILLLAFDFLLGNDALGFMLRGTEIEAKCMKLHLLGEKKMQERGTQGTPVQ